MKLPIVSKLLSLVTAPSDTPEDSPRQSSKLPSTTTTLSQRPISPSANQAPTPLLRTNTPALPFRLEKLAARNNVRTFTINNDRNHFSIIGILTNVSAPRFHSTPIPICKLRDASNRTLSELLRPVYQAPKQDKLNQEAQPSLLLRDRTKEHEDTLLLIHRVNAPPLTHRPFSLRRRHRRSEATVKITVNALPVGASAADGRFVTATEGEAEALMWTVCVERGMQRMVITEGAEGGDTVLVAERMRRAVGIHVDLEGSFQGLVRKGGDIHLLAMLPLAVEVICAGGGNL